ncbi:MAG: helix-turn-helix domain-containing protein [Chitinophagaceae bacterium]
MSLPVPDSSNHLFNLALEMVTASARNIFLTGKAGTGKTTFLRYIRDKVSKQMAIVAPTGVAAINAGGVTIHSFFQLPLSPFVPEGPGLSGEREEFINSYTLISRLKIQKEKQKILQQLELLVIDEISMVRCDTLDAMDAVLRHIRQRQSEPFGGVQVLFIGDMFQLPPVVRDETWEVLRNFYASPYFFDSRVVRDQPPVYIEFDKIYRQSETRFINLLNQVRNNELDAEGLHILESRYLPDFKRTKADGYITLTTHNEKAREINSQELSLVKSGVEIYAASIEGEFPENSFPAEEHLHLKIGAQVMFIKNDPERAKRYFNGKIGVITELEEEKVVVECLDGSEPIEVNREKWENIRYTLNPSTRKMEQDLLGSFTQYPLRLAWAITIHKSQGLTFERAVIDAGRSFASGQVYVALSRCTSLEGLVLQSRISQGVFFTDRRIVDFSRRKSSSAELQQELILARQQFHQKNLLGLFDFSSAENDVLYLHTYIDQHSGSFSSSAAGFAQQLLDLIRSLQEVSRKFINWMKNEFRKEGALHTNPDLVERVGKAVGYFKPRMEEIQLLIRSSTVSTDSRLHAKEFNDSVRDIFSSIALKEKLMAISGDLPELEKMQEMKNSFIMPPFAVNAYGGPVSSMNTSKHPVLYQQLRKLRDQICSKRDLPLYIVAGTKSIEEMADFLPQTKEDLLRINGFGEAKVKAYGDEFIRVILEYCAVRNIDSGMDKPDVTPKKQVTAKKKTSTRVESLRFFRDGLKVEEIAVRRGLTVGTIESHLASCVSNGELNVEELLSREKLLLIEPVLETMGEKTLAVIKQELGESVGFGDIRITMAWQEFKRSQSKSDQ